MKTKAPIFIIITSIFLFVTLVLSTRQGYTQNTPIVQNADLVNNQGVAEIAHTLEFTPTDWIYLPIIHTPCVTTDDFSEDSSGWNVDNTADGKWAYINNEYQIFPYGNHNFTLRAMAPFEAQENYTVEIDMRWNGSSTTEVHGLVFGADSVGDNAQYYFFVIYYSSSTGLYKYRLLRRLGGDFIILTNAIASTEIKPGTAVNHLAVSRQGNNIDLYINGTRVHQLTDSTLTGSTYTGVAMISDPDNSGEDARFDNFKITGCVASTSVSTLQQQTPSVDAVDMIWE